MRFEKQEVSCLAPCLSRVQTLEQTQEVALPEGGEARVLGTWGQSVMRSKEWMGSSILLTGGVQVWVLYESEAGELQCLSSWIPFRMEWEAPEEAREGWVRIRTLLRSADARPVAAGKLLIRVGVAALAEAFCPRSAAVYSPGEPDSGMQLLRSQWPVRLRKAAGEKPFELEQDLILPDSVPEVSKLLSWQLDTKVTDQKILGNKILFRGTGNLHMVYLTTEKLLRCWDFEIPFSQYGELQEGHSADASADVAVAVTRLELEQQDGKNLHLRTGLTGQYVVEERQLLETVEDAFCPRRELKVSRDVLPLPVVLDSRRETVTQQQTLQISADVIADQVFRPDFPQQHREGEMIRISQSGTLQLMYYDENGTLRSTSVRMEGEVPLAQNETAELTAVPGEATLQLHGGRDTAQIRTEMALHLCTAAEQEIPMITGLEPGEKIAPREGMPALILCRAGNRRLWDIARECGSTVSAIETANGLTGEPETDRMLLIPVV